MYYLLLFQSFKLSSTWASFSVGLNLFYFKNLLSYFFEVNDIFHSVRLLNLYWNGDWYHSLFQSWVALQILSFLSSRGFCICLLLHCLFCLNRKWIWLCLLDCLLNLLKSIRLVFQWNFASKNLMRFLQSRLFIPENFYLIIAGSDCYRHLNLIEESSLCCKYLNL